LSRLIQEILQVHVQTTTRPKSNKTAKLQSNNINHLNSNNKVDSNSTTNPQSVIARSSNAINTPSDDDNTSSSNAINTDDDAATSSNTIDPPSDNGKAAESSSNDNHYERFKMLLTKESKKPRKNLSTIHFYLNKTFNNRRSFVKTLNKAPDIAEKFFTEFPAMNDPREVRLSLFERS